MTGHAEGTPFLVGVQHVGALRGTSGGFRRVLFQRVQEPVGDRPVGLYMNDVPP